MTDYADLTQLRLTVEHHGDELALRAHDPSWADDIIVPLPVDFADSMARKMLIDARAGGVVHVALPDVDHQGGYCVGLLADLAMEIGTDLLALIAEREHDTHFRVPAAHGVH